MHVPLENLTLVFVVTKLDSYLYSNQNTISSSYKNIANTGTSQEFQYQS